VFASSFFESKLEWTKNLDLEALNDALSFEIKKYRGQNFREDSYSYARWSHGPSLKLSVRSARKYLKMLHENDER
jgi:hypothetical protein